MEQYISKSALVAEIDRLVNNYDKALDYEAALEDVRNFIDTLEVKEADEKPNPRFPHYEDIVDKVFGAGNLELWEYEEAEQLVLLAKEELLKDLEVKEVDLEKELDSMITPELKFHKALPSLSDVAKHFFELGLKAQKGE